MRQRRSRLIAYFEQKAELEFEKSNRLAPRPMTPTTLGEMAAYHFGRGVALRMAADELRHRQGAAGDE